MTTANLTETRTSEPSACGVPWDDYIFQCNVATNFAVAQANQLGLQVAL